jgi:hypothetical protein
MRLQSESGTSTKYLSNYIQFVNFKRQHAGKSTARCPTSFLRRCRMAGKSTRWKDLKAMGYPDFVVERYMGAKEEPKKPGDEDIPFKWG